MTGGRMASFVCADCALMVSVPGREKIKLWDADFFPVTAPKLQVTSNHCSPHKAREIKSCEGKWPQQVPVRFSRG